MSSNTDEWATPIIFYQELNNKYHFNLDPCASNENHKCELYFTKQQNGLNQDWTGKRVFCNPPYGRQISQWVKKAYEENKKGSFIVMLLPARTDTKWFHNYIYNIHEIIFLKGRLKFNDGKQAAPFPSMLVIMKVK